MEPPPGYEPTPLAQALPSLAATATPTPMGTPLYQLPDGTTAAAMVGSELDQLAGVDEDLLPFIKPEDVQYFSKLMNQVRPCCYGCKRTRDRGGVGVYGCVYVYVGVCGSGALLVPWGCSLAHRCACVFLLVVFSTNGQNPDYIPTKEEMLEREVLTLLLKIKNGMPSQRKTAMRQLTNRAREFGAGLLIDSILPLLM